MVKSNVTSRSNATANTSKKTHSATSSTSSKKKFVSPADSAAFAKLSDGQQRAGSKFFPQPLYDRMNQDLHLTYSVTCKRPWDIFSMLKLQNVQTLPEVITIEQVHQIIDTATTLRMKTFFWTVYSLGLRLNEGLHLQVGDIDAPRGMVRVHAPQYLRELEQSQANIQIRRVLQAIMQCRTGALGGVKWGVHSLRPHSLDRTLLRQ